MKKRWFALITLLSLINSGVYAKIFEVSNRYIKIGLDDNTGRFILETIEGDPENPSDNDKNLLYRKIPPTSLTTIQIDDEPFIFGSEKGNFKRRAEVEGNRIITEWSVKGIAVIQELSIVKGLSTGREDSMRVLYKIRNENRRATKVGVRILLDTFLGDKDGAAFRVPGVGDIANETQFYRDNIPEYWYSFDSYINPQVRSQGILIGPGVTKPDKVVFASWDRLYDNLWDFMVDSSKDLKRVGTTHYDSAVALYYNAIELQYNDMMYITTSYGLYGVSFFASGDMTMTLSVPATPKSPPIPVAVDLKNTGQNPIDKLQMEIEVPEGFKLVEGEQKLMEFVKVNTNDIKKALWHLTSGSIGGNYTVKVKATGWKGENSQSIDASKSFLIDYLEDKVVKKDDVVQELEKKMEEKVEEKKAIIAQTNKAVTNLVVTPVKKETVPPVVKETPLSDEELKLLAEIDSLNQLIDEVDKKYQILIEVYRGTYVTNQALATLNDDINKFYQRMKQEESILSNQKASIKETE